MLRHQTRSGLSALLLMVLLLGGCASPPQGLVFIDELNALQDLDVTPLTGRGASVVVVLSQKKAPDLQQLERAGDPNLLAVIVSLEPRHSELRAGVNFSQALPPRTLERIREQLLNPPLQEGRYQLGFIQACEALENELKWAQTIRRIAACVFLGVMGAWFLYLIRPETFAFLWARKEAQRQRQRAQREREEELARLAALGGSLAKGESATLGELRAEVTRLKEIHLRAERLVEWRRRAYAAVDTLKPRKKKKLDPARYEVYKGRLEALEREAPPDLLERLIQLTEEIAPTPLSEYSSSPTSEPAPSQEPNTSSYTDTDYSSSSPGESRASGDW